MPQQSYSGSVYVVRPTTQTYTASVSTQRTKSYTASVNPVIRPDRFYTASVEARAWDGDDKDRDWNASIYAHFTPITPDRSYTGTVYAAPSSVVGQFYNASIAPVELDTFTQNYSGSVTVIVPVNKTYTASVVAKGLNIDEFYKGSIFVGSRVDKTYTASVVCKALNIAKSYMASVRPFVDISPAEHTIRNADINELIFLVQEINSLTTTISQQQAQLSADQTSVTDLVAVLNAMTDKPSCRLSSIMPNAGIPRTGGITMTCSGFEFIPTCTVHLSQGIISVGTFTPLETAITTLNFTLPDFTQVGGLNLAQPISIVVNNADGETSETLTFTLAS